jgi:hypothetical protein
MHPYDNPYPGLAMRGLAPAKSSKKLTSQSILDSSKGDSRKAVPGKAFMPLALRLNV